MALTSTQIAFVEKLIFPDNVATLFNAISAFGFDALDYVTQNADLRANNLDAEAGLYHFLVHGYQEDRKVKIFPVHLAGAIDTFLSFKSAYAKHIMGALIVSYVQSQTDIWKNYKEIRSIIQTHPAMMEFFVIGDSHSHRYNFCVTGQRNDTLVPIHLLCSGASAIGLERPGSKSNYGERILRWSEEVDKKRGASLLLKFGQIDVEFVWVFRRVRENNVEFTMDHFDEFTDEFVNGYARFIKKLKDSLPREYTISVCSIFPPMLSDEAWARGYVNAHIGFLEGDRELNELSEAIKKIEVPDLQARLKMHASYNKKLEIMCENEFVAFVNDFDEIMRCQDILQTYAGEDHHIPDIPEVRGALSRLIQQFVGKHTWRTRETL